LPAISNRGIVFGTLSPRTGGFNAAVIPSWIFAANHGYSFAGFCSTYAIGLVLAFGFAGTGEVLEIHFDDLLRLGLPDGSRGLMSSRRGSVETTLRATTRSPRGTVFTTFTFHDTPVNNLTGSGYDPITQPPN
jgi:anaerobic selenocysteine-containing dehydrogenase